MLYVTVEMNWRYHYKNFDYECFVLQVREARQALTRNGLASASSDRELREPCTLD